ncbi:HutD/Ves family protein [Providencia sp. Me31A]|uniref:HutD/Ves family protein n=1 Tax=Providencia sp. Me31A TaxID=3392637 RepID=UPI003D2B0232
MAQILTMQDYRNMPWKNGQGSTLELARSHGEGLDDFDWRVSIADVKTAGSFSFFQKRQRIIGVLEGKGLILHVDKKPAVTLKQKEFFAFNGESEVYAELVQGAIRDFNLIYNPEKYQARLQWVDSALINTWVSGASEILIFNITPNTSININSASFCLKPFDTLLIRENREVLQFIVENNTRNDFCIIELFIK